MLDDGGDRFDRHWFFAGEGVGHIFLIADAELSFASSNEGCGGVVVARLDDVDSQAFICEVAFFLRHIDAGVVCVRGIV